MRRLIPALLLSFVAATAFAQTVDEFGRFYEGTLDMMARKSPGNGFSGSLGVTAGRSDLGFGSSGQRYDASFGGTLVKDKAWFFASAERGNSLYGTQNLMVAPSANLGDKQTLDAMFSSARSSTLPGTVTLPKTFMNLHYTGIITPNSFFTATVTQTK